MKLRARSRSWLPKGSAYVFVVDPGALAFAGRIEARAKAFQRTPEIAIATDPEREREAWEQVLSKYPDSPWSARVTARIAALR